MGVRLLVELQLTLVELQLTHHPYVSDLVDAAYRTRGIRAGVHFCFEKGGERVRCQPLGLESSR